MLQIYKSFPLCRVWSVLNARGYIWVWSGKKLCSCRLIMNIYVKSSKRMKIARTMCFLIIKPKKCYHFSRIFKYGNDIWNCGHLQWKWNVTEPNDYCNIYSIPIIRCPLLPIRFVYENEHTPYTISSIFSLKIQAIQKGLGWFSHNWTVTVSVFVLIKMKAHQTIWLKIGSLLSMYLCTYKNFS